MDSNTNTVATVNAAAAAASGLCGLTGCQNPTHDGNVGCNPFHTAIINQKINQKLCFVKGCKNKRNYTIGYLACCRGHMDTLDLIGFECDTCNGDGTDEFACNRCKNKNCAGPDMSLWHLTKIDTQKGL